MLNTEPVPLPGAPGHLVLAECARWQWRVGEPGDPLRLLEQFLGDLGLPVGDLAAGSTGRGRGPVVGAAVHVSAAAAAAAAGAPRGPASPTPAVPDVVAVAYVDVAAAGSARRRPAPGGSAGRLRQPWQRHEGSGESDTGRPRPWRLGEWRPSWSPAAHAGAVRRLRAAIAAGDVYQANLVGHARARYRGDPLPALARVARLPGARYGGLLTGAGWALGCGSPETLVEVRAGVARTRPIKGTRPATAQGRAALRGSAKEHAEHIMIVDLVRNDLALVARTGGVRVESLYAVRRWCDLWQAESVVSAALADGVGLATLLGALAPGGSVTGAPKLAALRHIAALEPVGRGPSMGALGWVGRDHVDLGLTIRTAAADATQLHLWAGGGITWGSDPEAEVAEAAAKAAPIRAALAG
ncbi:MAG TPA: chorismate-binding protein [Pilimelia sp.]|nr:chorismate-binding protein [Pilimelia sp.]